MAHIVVVGASTGGLPTVYDLKKRLGDRHRISLVSNTPTFHFVPSNPWVAVGWRKREQISFKLAEVMAYQEIDFYDCGVKEIEAQYSRLHLNDNTMLSYDYLVVATGPKLAFDEISGYGPEGFTQSICSVDHAEAAYQDWQKFIENPGPIVVGAVQGASCFGPAYEYALLINRVLRKAKVRHQVPITFITPEPYIGHMGVSSIGDSKSLFESEFRKNDIKWITNAKVTEITDGKMQVEEFDEQGKVVKQHELPFNYSMLIPAFKGVDCVANMNEAAVNSRGFLKVDEFQRNPLYPNVFGVGVCIAIPPVEPTPLTVGVPKTGYMIESMSKATVDNIEALVNGREPISQASGNAICLGDFGNTGAAFVAAPQIPPRNMTWMKKGLWVRWLKVAFEKYFIYKMKHGIVEMWLEKQLLRLIHAEKIKNNNSD